MRQHIRFSLLTLSACALLGCGNNAHDGQAAVSKDEAGVTPQVAKKAEPVFESSLAKASPPFRVEYEIIGAPIVGSPVTVDLRVDSAMGPVPVQLNYRIEDLSSMSFHEAQPRSIVRTPAANEASVNERVTLIPQREGRLYLNVSASVETEDGTTSTVISIPIHVGEVSTAPVEHGVIEKDENDESVRVLTPD
ncbi:MAG: hypothetical protein GY783_16445 [Gammaproteobacteria bacterium]|nr:hypothetical protein [Gammaproteobacteria bacterium]